MKTQKALENALSLVRDRVELGNTHPSMLQTRTISASRLVKVTARDLAKEILTDDQTMKPEDVHWATNGNALAAMNLRQVPCQEPELRVLITGSGWTLTGHADGVAFHNQDGYPWHFSAMPSEQDKEGPWFGTVYENKAPLFDYDDADIEKAYRQGLLYLSMLMHQPRRVGIASWLRKTERDDEFGWDLPAAREPGQVVVCVTPYDSPKHEHAFPVTRDACEKHLSRYLVKALAVIKAVEADDPEVAAKEWDDKKDAGLGEFDLRERVMVINDDADFALALDIERVAAEQKRIAEEAHEAAKATLERYLKTRGLEEAEVNGCRVKLQRTKGGLRHFMVDDSVSLRVYGKRKIAKPAEVLVTA